MGWSAHGWEAENLDSQHMLSRYNYEYAPFGRKNMVFGGHFRLVLIFVLKLTCAEMVAANLVRYYLWPLMEKIQLSTNMRARKYSKFSDWLLRMRHGEETTIKLNL